MTVEEMIEQRTSALQTALGSANSAITAKGGTGDATTINGLADAIGSIPQSGGDVTIEPLSVTVNGTYTADNNKAYNPVMVNVPVKNRVLTIKSKTITIPANNVTNTSMAHAFFTEKAAEEGASNYISAALVEDYSSQNQLISTTSRGTFGSQMPQTWAAYRNRNNMAATVSYPNTSYDAVLVEGTHYVMIWVDELVTPT